MSFYIVEGPNGVGKTTLIKNLSARGYDTLSSPNGTQLAKMIRPACRGTAPWEDIDKKVQFLLFSAARLDEYIRLVHGNLKTVVADRWWTSTYVYQCMLQGISVEFLEQTIHDAEKIDGVILLDAQDDILINRMIKEREQNPDHGKCRWTLNTEDTIKLANIYRTSLTEYLASKKIPVIKIDTSYLTTNEVLQKTEEVLQKGPL